jgi:outer membrane protein assembly factor BamB/tetratricopeptide (TPR) repeat protein
MAAVALLGTLVCLQTALAQKRAAVQFKRPPVPVGGPVKPPSTFGSGDPTDLGGITLTPDETEKIRLEKKIKRAADNIEIEDWNEAVHALQDLLDRPQDVFIAVERKTDAGLVRNIQSVRSAATQMIGNLPPRGREFYRVTFGPQATEDLKSADGHPEFLAKVMQRYLYTEAGGQATEQLASHLLDRGRYSTAALCFERLFRRGGPDKLSPLTLFKAALAFHHAGDTSNEARAWKVLEAKTDSVALGNGKNMAIGDLKTWVARRATRSAHNERFAWHMTFGDPTRSAQGDGTTAFLEPVWKYSLITEETTRTYLDTALRALNEKRQPALHSFSPLAVTLNRENGQVPLVVYRSFYGIHARVLRNVNLGKDDQYKAGDLYWEAPGTWSLDRMFRDGTLASHVRGWLDQMYMRVKPQILFENSTVGSLTTDGVRVYAVDDFMVPPFYNQFQFNRGGVIGTNLPQRANEALYHSRLQAYDLDSGKLLWEVGGKSDPAAPKDLKDTYFLGPPLPLSGKLYVLCEHDQELRLVALDPTTGKVLGRPQRLADARDKMLADVGRRIHASHLAYGEGILVCPTNAGGLLGVDLLTNSLVWAYGYREKPMGSLTPIRHPRFGQAPPGMIWTDDGRQIPAPMLSSGRKVTPPVIASGRVVYTAPDASSVHCLNLRDGARVWKVPCSDNDLYLGGVFNGKVLIVGKGYVRAVALADGSDLFRLETGIPSGIGIASKDVYYLPLSESAKTREPEICLIDLDRGRILAHTRSRKKPGKEQEVPGSLLFYEGDVISQGLKEITVYPQLEVELKTIDALLAKNPNDPTGRARRGDLRLDKGDLAGAIEDLEVALKQESKLPADTAAKARDKLYESLTEYLQVSFDSAEKHLKEYEAMCRGVPGKDKAEQKRRLGTFYCLVGKGREAQALRSRGETAQRKLIEAFEAYMNFGTLGNDGELMGVVDDPGVKAAPSVWSRGRIAAMVAKADAETRAPLEALIGKRWEKIKGGTDLDPMRGFVDTFGAFSEVGRQARLQLAERLIQDSSPASLVEAERHLSLLRLQKDDPKLSACAVEALARLMTRRGLMEDATYFYRVLGRDYPHQVVRDGKTGIDFYNDLATDKRLLPYLDGPTPLFDTKVTHDMIKPNEPGRSMTGQFRLDQEGERLPFFQQNAVVINTNSSRFVVLDRDTGKELWAWSLTGAVNVGQLTRNHVAPQLSPRLTYKTLGHLIVLQLGHMVYGFDPVRQAKLWEMNLAGSSQPTVAGQPVVDPRDGSLRVLYTDNWMQRLGQTGPLSPVALCVLTRDSLVALDPVSGKVLWRRADMPRKAHLYNDDEHVYVVEVDDRNIASTTRVFRLQDGVDVKARDFSTFYENRVLPPGGVGVQGRLLLTADSTPRGLTVRLYDVLAGEDRWSMDFPAGSQVLQAQDADLSGAVEPDGKLTVFDLGATKGTKEAREAKKPAVLFKGQIDPKSLENLVSVHLLRDRKYVYVACNVRPAPEVSYLMSNLMPGSGLRALPINGEIYCFRADTGEMWWHNGAPNQMILLDEFEDLPILQMTARYNRRMNNFNTMQYVVYRSYDKRTGKMLNDQSNAVSGQQQFHTLNVDLRNRKIELASNSQTVVYDLSRPASGASARSGAGGPGARKPRTDDVDAARRFPPGVTRPGAAPGRVTRPAIEVPVPVVLPAVRRR